MIIAIDCETYRKDEKGDYKPILNATGKYFTLGCVYKESGGNKVFYSRRKMWKYILELGEKERKRGKKLTCYGHNIKYDFYQVADLKDKNLKWFSENPFIVSYLSCFEKKFESEEKMESWLGYAKKCKEIQIVGRKDLVMNYRKETIKFLDTMSLYRMSLKRVGEVIGVSKEEMPDKLRKIGKKKDLKRLEKYCMNDCKVTLRSVQYIKRRLKEDGIILRNLCTINQIAISYVIKDLRKEKSNHLLKVGKDGLTQYTWKTNYKREIHSAYRGGFVRAWKLGCIEGVSSIDFNSLYPYSLSTIDFPDLRTERKVKKPLDIYSLNELLDKIGVSKVMIVNEFDELGLLPIRTTSRSYIPKKGKMLIGTWTHIELKEAVKSGYKIVDVEWSVLWDKGENLFGKVFKKIYEKRMKANNEFDNYFYKMILNGSIGKFGQARQDQELVIDSVEKVYEYMQKSFEIVRGLEESTDMLYVNKNAGKGKIKSYYAPVIPCLTTAMARVIMYRGYKKVGKDNLCYSDTDNIIATGDFIGKFKIGMEMGEYKVERDVQTGDKLINTRAIIWGTKSKSIGNNIALSGVHKSDINMELFKKGKVKTRRMKGLKLGGLKDVGKFIIEERDLMKQNVQFKRSKRLMDSQKLYIDSDIDEISYFAERLKSMDLQIGIF